MTQILRNVTNSSYYFPRFSPKSIEISTFTLYNIERDISYKNLFFMKEIVSKKWNYIILFHNKGFEIIWGVKWKIILNIEEKKEKRKKLFL